MTIASLANAIGLPSTLEFSPEGLSGKRLSAVKAASANLVKAIQDGSVTADQIDSFLQKNLGSIDPQYKADISEFLIATKATLLFEEGDRESGLRAYDEALRIKETPATWALKATGFLQLERIDEAFKAFQKAYSLRDQLGVQKKNYLVDIFATWSAAALIQGLMGIQDGDPSTAENGVHQYLDVLSKAEEEGLNSAVASPPFEGSVSGELQDNIAELALMIRLLSIKDPFQRWREFTKEISKVWPKAVSATDAIREQRK
jgi:tetratricopeptide (TPR) repeat protein